MSTLTFYRTQAIRQQEAADATTIDKIRDRCQEAADSWVAMAKQHEARMNHRAKLSAAAREPNENPDRGHASA